MKINNIKIYRAINGIKQECLAELINVSLSTYSLKENAKYDFSLSEAKKLSDFFNVSIEELFFNHKVNFKNTQSE